LPTYEYACETCADLRFDRFVEYDVRDEPQVCPNCANAESVKRKMPMSSFQCRGGYDGRMKTIKGYKTK